MKSNMEDQKLDRLETKIDKLDDRLDAINLTLVKNTDVLDAHHQRSILLEKQVNMMEAELENELAPIKKHVDSVKYGIKALMWLGSFIVGLLGVLVVLKELGWLKL